MTPSSDDLYSQGYSLGQYDICEDVEIYRFKNEFFKIRPNLINHKAVKDVFPEAHGMIASAYIANIDDVRKAHENSR